MTSDEDSPPTVVEALNDGVAGTQQPGESAAPVISTPPLPAGLLPQVIYNHTRDFPDEFGGRFAAPMVGTYVLEASLQAQQYESRIRTLEDRLEILRKNNVDLQIANAESNRQSNNKAGAIRTAIAFLVPISLAQGIELSKSNLAFQSYTAYGISAALTIIALATIPFAARKGRGK